MRITGVKAAKVLNSRAEPTIVVRVSLGKGYCYGTAPSGASKGKYEVKAFPKGIASAIRYAGKINLRNIDIECFEDFKKIEGKYEPKKLGSGLMIALEFSILQALSLDLKKPIWKILNPRAYKMPTPLTNLVGGGAHTRAKSIDIQEILFAPKKARNFLEAVFKNIKFKKEIEDILIKKDKHFTGNQTDEGAFTTRLSAAEVLKLLDKNIRGAEVGLDIAATQLYKIDKKYHWTNLTKHRRRIKLTKQRQIQLIKEMYDKFKPSYIEDPLEETDWEGFSELTNEFGNKTLICGDDLICTNPRLLERAVEMKAINAVIVKPNQVGSLVKTRETIKIAKKNNIVPIISHRSGATCDTTIAHLAFGWQVPYVKFGAIHSERISRVNELIKIEKGLC